MPSGIAPYEAASVSKDWFHACQNIIATNIVAATFDRATFDQIDRPPENALQLVRQIKELPQRRQSSAISARC